MAIILCGCSRRVVSASSDRTLKVWDTDSDCQLRTLAGHSGTALGVALSGNERRAVSVSSDNTVKAWDLEKGEVVATFICDAVPQCCAWGGSAIVIVDNLGQVHFLSLEL